MEIRNIAEEKRFDFVGIYDANTEQSKDVATIYNVTPFETMDILLDYVDAVVVAVPSSFRLVLLLSIYGEHMMQQGTDRCLLFKMSQ